MGSYINWVASLALWNIFLKIASKGGLQSFLLFSWSSCNQLPVTGIGDFVKVHSVFPREVLFACLGEEL